MYLKSSKETGHMMFYLFAELLWVSILTAWIMHRHQ
jgi:hypothetical protein